MNNLSELWMAMEQQAWDDASAKLVGLYGHLAAVRFVVGGLRVDVKEAVLEGYE